VKEEDGNEKVEKSTKEKKIGLGQKEDRREKRKKVH
jgi:hypothetical protein